MRWLEINKSQPLKGTIKVPGSKNSSLGLIAASCLANEPVYLENVPKINDIKVMTEIGEEIGLVIKSHKGQLVIDPRKIHSSLISPKKSVEFRTAYYFIGSLLAKFKKVSVGFPGGDKIGPRPIDQHIKGFRALGAEIEFFNDYYVVQADKLIGAEIYFDVITSGATINLMMAAVLATGKTTLHNAARDPEVVDIAIFLNKMGARIFGAGTDTIRIEGVTSLGGCTHPVIPDRLIAGAYLIGAGVTGGQITVTDVIPEHLESCIEKLTEIGVTVDKSDNSLTAYANGDLRPTKVRAGMYPVFGSDLQQPFTTLLLNVKGKSQIVDSVFPERFHHCVQLRRMGADINIQKGSAYINGISSLTGAWVHASDIRAGTCLILAGLIAEKTTFITGVDYIERGYEDIVNDFSSLGADIRLSSDNLKNSDIKDPYLLNTAAKIYPV